MRDGFRGLAEFEMDKEMRPFYKARPVVPPARGWIRELRQVSGIPAAEIAKRLNVTPTELHRLERAERDGTISLKKLRKMAEAMECQLVYGVVWRERPVFSKAAEMADKYLWQKRIHRRWK